MTSKTEDPSVRKPIFEQGHDNTQHLIFPADSKPYGLSYREWTTRWWEWLISIPLERNPARDLDGKYSDQNQNEENVWYLAGTVKPFFSATRVCHIPAVKAIFFPIISTVISYAEDPSLRSDSDLVSFAGKDITQASHLEAQIDGMMIEHVEKYRVSSGPFDLKYPSSNIFEASPGISRAASDGYWVFLKPLGQGQHRIHFQGVEPNFSTDVWYSIIVE